MRIVALLILLCAYPGIASAQTAEKCPPSGRAGDLLNCYNGIAPPPAVGRPKRSKDLTASTNTAAVKDPVAGNKPASNGQAPYVDMLDVENKKLGARMKTLCHGC
jgi:hypothetical protein